MSETQRRQRVDAKFHPAYVVWELTLACDQRCTHCGSRAATERPNELTTEQALSVVAQLKAAGTRDVVLIGGEAYLHSGFLEIVAALKAAGIRPSVTTGGRGVDAELARGMAQAGVFMVSVSIDGLEATHDLMRATRGGFQSALQALAHMKAAGVRIAANTNLNRLNERDLEALYETLGPTGIESWQIQITAPLGRAADRAAMLLQPWDLVDLMQRIVALKQRAWAERRISILPGNNLGYFDRTEAQLRTPPNRPPQDHFQGCVAGRYVMGIESDGSVKGCPSLQSSYIGGNVKQTSLAELWANAPTLAFARKRTRDDLWGFCKDCPFAETCLGGCTFTAHSVLGRPGNNPYCAYRASVFKKKNQRERLVPAEAAPGLPFDNGRFDIVVEAFDAPDPRPPTPQQLVRKHTQGTG